jgi:hypothetical protein
MKKPILFNRKVLKEIVLLLDIISIFMIKIFGLKFNLKPKRKESALLESKTVKIQILRIENKGM